MAHTIDLLSIQTPKYLRKGLENRSRFDCGNFEINIFETFQSSTQVEIKYDGLSISGMIRGKKIIHKQHEKDFEFLPGTSLILPEGQSIYANFPDADDRNPVQCATVLIPHKVIDELLKYFNETYPKSNGNEWSLNLLYCHFNNNPPLVRAFNELLQLINSKQQSLALNDLLLKSFLMRIIDVQNEHIKEYNPVSVNHKLFLIKQYIKKKSVLSYFHRYFDANWQLQQKHYLSTV
ncbi:AraC family transcriptional regulator N-terminal domain-containing protein [Sinomicrobium sp.]